MAERLVLCGGTFVGLPRHQEALQLDLTGSRPNITLRLEDISRRMVANVPELLTDLIEVATYVFCADQLISRGGDMMRGMGSDWRRKFRFVIPVRSPNHWSSPGMLDTLTELLGFLCEDEFRFEFTELSGAPPFQSYLDLEREGPSAFQADEIILFSGGMDSLGGALERLSGEGHRVALVSHQSSPKMYERQRHLANELTMRFPGRVLHVPVRVTKHGGLRSVENTQRSRTFLFGALAVATARILSRNHICFFENGVVSFNLPIAWQVVGTRATRTTHPRVLNDMAQFFSALMGEEIEVDNPFVWKTKTDVAELIGASGHVDLLRHSVSCSRVHSMTKLHTHCGTCSQCLDRRFATLAAGLEDDDPEEMYRVDLLSGERRDGEERTMAEAFMRRALEFRRMTEIGFVGQCAGEVSRTAPCFPGMSSDSVMQSVFELHRRHGDAVHAALTRGVKSYADDLVSGTLPASCIVRMAIREHRQDLDHAPLVDPVEAEAKSDRAKKREDRTFDTVGEIRLSLDDQVQRVMLEGVPPVTGPANYSLIAQLVAQYRQDREAGRAPENFRYTSARELAETFAIREPTLRRRVNRFRKQAAERFEDRNGLPLMQDAIIETREWKGYRINPRVWVVEPGELKVRDTESRNS